MILLWPAFCLIVTAIANIRVAAFKGSPQLQGIQAQDRPRRGVLNIGKDLLTAMKARRLLLSKAKLTFDDGRQLDFVKPGTFEDALRDFKAVNPSNIKAAQENAVTVQSGMVGNMRVVLRTSKEDGYATMSLYQPMLFSSKTGTNNMVYNIMYNSDRYNNVPFKTEFWPFISDF